MSICIHNSEPDVEDPFAYEPDVYNNRDSVYYKNAILGAVRAIDYIFSRSDFDGENMGLLGVSQGAGLSTIVAGLDQRVNLLAASNPALTEHAGMKYDKANGFPYYLFNSRGVFATPQHEEGTLLATQYFDAVNFAKRYSGPVLFVISYEDNITPPANSFAAFNEFTGPKILLHAIELAHNHPSEYWSGRLDFIRRHYDAALTPPIPNGGASQGYFISAGSDQTTTIGSTINLAGLAEFNGAPLSLPMKWCLKEGSGNVTFSSPNNATTNATFSTSGTYIITLEAIDDQYLASDFKRYSLIDQIVITVQ